MPDTEHAYVPAAGSKSICAICGRSREDHGKFKSAYQRQLEWQRDAEAAGSNDV